MNDERVTEPIPVRLGDRILLGHRGPLLIVEGLGTAPQMPVARPPLGPKTVRGLINDAIAQVDGMTIGGSSGSPLFNANGEVIAIHRAGLPQAPGFALSVPIKHSR